MTDADNDLQPLISLSNLVADNPTEPNLEAFLQAYNVTQPPAGQIEAILFEVLGDVTMDLYLHSCTCEHIEEEQ